VFFFGVYSIIGRGAYRAVKSGACPIRYISRSEKLISSTDEEPLEASPVAALPRACN
jgi:hypothetical protein